MCRVGSGKEDRSDIPTSCCSQKLSFVQQFIIFSVALVAQLLRVNCKPVGSKIPGFRKATKQKTPILYNKKESDLKQR